MAFINKDGLQHLTNQLVKAENIKVASLRGSNIKEVIDNIQRECDNVAQPNTMSIENRVSKFKTGSGINANVSKIVKDGISIFSFKGRTWLNVVRDVLTLNGGATYDQGIFTIPDTAKRFEGITFNAITKTGCNYTVVLDVIENFELRPAENGSVYKVQINDGANQYNKSLKVGRNIFKIYTNIDSPNKTVSILSLDRGNGNMRFKYPIILEGDYTNLLKDEFPESFQGIKSIAEENRITISSKSNNIANLNDVYSSSKGNDVHWKLLKKEGNSFFIQGDGHDRNAFALGLTLRNLKKNTQYFISYKVNGAFEKVNYVYQGENNLWNIEYEMSVSDNSFTTDNYINTATVGLFYSRPYNKVYEISDIQVSEYPTKKYSVYSKEKKDFILDEPLRSLPNGVYDEITSDGKVIRRIKEIILDGTENFLLEGVNDKFISLSMNPQMKANSPLYCDRLPCVNMVAAAQTNPIGVAPTDSNRLRIKPYDKNNMTFDKAKQWLKDNPIKVLYQMDTPIISKIKPISIFTPENSVIEIDANIPPISTHTVILNRSGQIEQGIELIAKLRNKIDDLEREYDNNLLNTQLQINNLKLNLKLKGDK